MVANTTIDLRTFKVESTTLTMVGKANPNRAVKEPKVRGSNPLGRTAKVPAKVLLCFGFPQHCHSHQFGWWATWWAKLSRSFPPTLLRHVECPARSCAHRCRMLSTCANAPVAVAPVSCLPLPYERCCRPYDGRCEIHASVCRDQLPHDPSPDRARPLEPNPDRRARHRPCRR